MTQTLSGVCDNTPKFERIPTRDIAFSAANHGRELKVDELIPSIEAEGIRIPLIVAPSQPGVPKTWTALDGNRRLAAALALGIESVLCCLLPEAVSQDEAIKLRLTTNTLRKGMSLREIGRDLVELMDLTGSNAKEVASLTKLSPTTVSRALCLTRMDPSDIETLAAAGVADSIVAMVGALSPRQQQIDAIAYLTTPPAKTRDQFQGWVDKQTKKKKEAQKAEQQNQQKPRAISLVAEGRRITVEIKQDDTPETLMKAIPSAVSQLAPYKGLSIEAVLAVFGGKGRSDS